MQWLVIKRKQSVDQPATYHMGGWSSSLVCSTTAAHSLKKSNTLSFIPLLNI